MHSPPPRCHTAAAVHLLTTYLVEDSAVIRENLSATLEELAPVRVVGWAADEASALHWLAQAGHAVDLVIVDIFLQAGSGLAVLRALAALPSAMRRVVLSNYATADIRRKCLALGADRVFDKSHEIEALIAYCTALAAEIGGHSADTAPS